ncbi:hypothetical protein FS842_009764 [Serendipita sp. 407]|nr:hypothetical protein FS842_009764 [Serendipita sp. 407]
MDPNRLRVNTKDPFPSTHLHPKLKGYLNLAGIEPDKNGRVPWKDVPYELYDRGFFISGLPRSLFFDKDNPSLTEQEELVKKPLKWPFRGLNPLKDITDACSIDNRVELLPRPSGRNVVFELVKGDGTTMDVGKWKAERSSLVSPATPTVASTSQINRGNPLFPLRSKDPGMETVETRPVITPNVQKNDRNVTQRVEHPIPSSSLAPPPKPKSTPKPQPLLPPSVDEPVPFPQSEQVPLKFRRLLRDMGLQQNKSGTIPWSTLPHVLWDKGLYITGIPANVVLGNMDPSLDTMEQKIKKAFVPCWNPSTIPALARAVEKDQVKILKRPPGRDITFEVMGKHRTYELGRWRNLDKENVQAPTEDTSSMFYEPPQKPVRRRHAKKSGVIDDSSDEEELIPFRWSKEVPLKLRTIFRDAGVKEDPDEPGYVPWQDIPDTLWRREYYITGLPKDFVLGKYTLEEVVNHPWKPQSVFNNMTMASVHLLGTLETDSVKLLKRPIGRNVVFEVKDGESMIDIGKWKDEAPSGDEDKSRDSFGKGSDSDDDGDADEQMEVDTPSSPKATSTLVKWREQENEVYDQLAELLVNAGVVLPHHGKREGAYKIVWDNLPLQLHNAKVCLTGIPLVLLPYWKDQGRLNGRWAAKLNRETVDRMAFLLDCDGIAVEKWPNPEIRYIVQATEDNPDRDVHKFTYDDFVNAREDNPEIIARGGVLRTPLGPEPSSRRRQTRRAVPPAEDDNSDDTGVQTESSLRISSKNPNLKRKASELFKDDQFSKRRKLSADDFSFSSLSLDEPMRDVSRERKNETGSGGGKFSHHSLLGSDESWIPKNISKLSTRELNRIFRRRKELIKHLIAILIFNNIPCIALDVGNGAYFLPWSNLPRHLAARTKYLAGFPAVCAPVVINESVITASGPYGWSDEQWDALEKALEANAISIVPAHNKRALFELVEEDGTRTESLLGYSRQWMDANFAIEAGQPLSLFAWEVMERDPIVEETDSEEDNSMDMET